jgi:hypothetical protein
VKGGIATTGNVYTGNIIITGTTANGIVFPDGTNQTTAASAAAAIAAGSYANSAFGVANSAALYANGAFIQANAAFIRANTPDAIANSSAVYANGAFIQANAAFAKANTAVGVGITDDTTTNASRYVTLSTVTTGTLATANTSSTKLYFNPSTGTLNSTSFNSLSDENQKTNIQIIPNSLEIVENIDGVLFDWVDNGMPSAGLLAQQVEKYLPQLVEYDKDTNTKSLNYNGVIGVLVEAVKTLSERVKELEKLRE